jgi:hypothetical protein
LTRPSIGSAGRSERPRLKRPDVLR